MNLILAPWEQRFNGRTWKDMPGTTPDDKKMNFALYRRGRLTEADVEAWEADMEEKQTTGKPGLNRAKRSLAKCFNKGRKHRVEQLRLQAEQRDLDALTIPSGGVQPLTISEPITEIAAAPSEMAETPVAKPPQIKPRIVRVITRPVAQPSRKARKPIVKVKTGGGKTRPCQRAEPTLRQVLAALDVMGKAEQEFWRLFEARYKRGHKPQSSAV